MSREIKFRAWLSKEEKMYEDTFAVTESGQMIVVEQDAVHLNPDYIFLDENEYALLQYTGLKDKNGVEIYEGDILYVEQIEVIDPYIPHKKNVAVKYDERDTAFAFDEDNGFAIGLYSMPRELEIIGNIYENPELLKE